MGEWQMLAWEMYAGCSQFSDVRTSGAGSPVFSTLPETSGLCFCGLLGLCSTAAGAEPVGDLAASTHLPGISQVALSLGPPAPFVPALPRSVRSSCSLARFVCLLRRKGL